jgi:hypothetical protein
MPEPIKTYTSKVRGRWSPHHTILDSEGQALGVMSVSRNRWGMVTGAEYRPEKGEVLYLRRDPGLLRAQFSLWTDNREWLGSSLRWHVGRRQVDVWTGGKPYRLVPRRGLGRGWRVVATKTGEAAWIKAPLVGRGCRIEQFRKMDFEMLLFCYFLGSLSLGESLLPTALDALDEGLGKTPATAKG